MRADEGFVPFVCLQLLHSRLFSTERRKLQGISFTYVDDGKKYSVDNRIVIIAIISQVKGQEIRPFVRLT